MQAFILRGPYMIIETHGFTQLQNEIHRRQIETLRLCSEKTRIRESTARSPTDRGDRPGGRRHCGLHLLDRLRMGARLFPAATLRVPRWEAVWMEATPESRYVADLKNAALANAILGCAAGFTMGLAGGIAASAPSRSFFVGLGASRGITRRRPCGDGHHPRISSDHPATIPNGHERRVASSPDACRNLGGGWCCRRGRLRDGNGVPAASPQGHRISRRPADYWPQPYSS